MKFYPSENITYVTKLSRNEIINKIQRSGEYQPIRQGYKDSIFDIKRTISYQNSFQPMITGRILEGQNLSTIDVEMKPHQFVSIFMTVWLGFALLVCILFLINTTIEELGVFFFIPWIMVIMGTVIFYGAFKYESTRSKKDLQRILEAEIVPKH